MTQKSGIQTPDIKECLKNLSVADFRNFGMEQVAYIRPVTAGHLKKYAIHSANGLRLSLADSLEDAIFATRDNDLEPVTVH